jgi:hypothetical protein
MGGTPYDGPSLPHSFIVAAPKLVSALRAMKPLARMYIGLSAEAP